MNKLKPTDSEKLLQEIEKLFRPILINGRGVNYNPDNKPIKAVDLQKCEMLEIEDYRGHNVKIIIRLN